MAHAPVFDLSETAAAPALSILCNQDSNFLLQSEADIIRHPANDDCFYHAIISGLKFMGKQTDAVKPKELLVCEVGILWRASHAHTM